MSEADLVLQQITNLYNATLNLKSQIDESVSQIARIYSTLEIYREKPSHGDVYVRPEGNTFFDVSGAVRTITETVPASTIYIINERSLARYIPSQIGLRTGVDANGWEALQPPYGAFANYTNNDVSLNDYIPVVAANGTTRKLLLTDINLVPGGKLTTVAGIPVKDVLTTAPYNPPEESAVTIYPLYNVTSSDSSTILFCKNTGHIKFSSLLPVGFEIAICNDTTNPVQFVGGIFKSTTPNGNGIILQNGIVTLVHKGNGVYYMSGEIGANIDIPLEEEDR